MLEQWVATKTHQILLTQSAWLSTIQTLVDLLLFSKFSIKFKVRFDVCTLIFLSLTSAITCIGFFLNSAKSQYIYKVSSPSWSNSILSASWVLLGFSVHILSYISTFYLESDVECTSRLCCCDSNKSCWNYKLS
jgi:hypothetical protein